VIVVIIKDLREGGADNPVCAVLRSAGILPAGFIASAAEIGPVPQLCFLKSFLCVSAFIFSVFFHPQKVHYNALFAKIRPQHAL
jgi:hypothetical protein